ncbi:MAG: flagellar brake protein [Rhizobacter sp.]|nr:flagellar brake protein [Rhizobacter sp.]
MDTLPMPLEELAATHGGLHEFRLTSKVEVRNMLQRLCDDNVTLNLNAPDGSACAMRLWTVDGANGAISFSANADDPQLQGLLQCNEAVAVCYLDNIKLQFDLQGLMLVHSGMSSALKCAMPGEMFRFQRRESFRVKPVLRNAPVARLRHPMIPEMKLSLRILDVSIGGCALFLPADVPPLTPGVLLNGVLLELTPETKLQTNLRLQHVSVINQDAKGSKLGCEMVNPARDSQRDLQAFIDQTQKRRRLMVLS